MNNKAHLRPDDFDSNGDIKVDGGTDMKNCENCDYYVNNYGYGQCYGQKNAPRVDDNDCCDDFKARTTMNESEVTMTDKIKRAIREEFHYRASQGRTNYSMEEVIYIVNEVIDEVIAENKVNNDNLPSVKELEEQQDIKMELRILKGDMKYLSEKINKLEDLVKEQR